MNILVIGNGFDLAHGLPTSYNDFLEFCKRVKRIYINDCNIGFKQYEQESLDGWGMNDCVKNRLKDVYQHRECKVSSEEGQRKVVVTTPDQIFNELYTNIERNTWLEYFFDCPSYVGENWIDFESEISRVIQSLDEARNAIENGGSVRDVQDEIEQILLCICMKSKWSLQTAYKNIRAIDNFTSFLITELDRLIRALEIYIADIVGKIKIEIKSLDIENLDPDHVLSFNYSDTYEREYGKEKNVIYDYIHGKADVKNTVETNSIVLGIDEYLEDDKKDKETEFIAFKKYYQRMHKQSKRLAEVWCEMIKKEAEYEKNSRKFMLEEQIGYELVSDVTKLNYSWQDYERLAREYDKEYNKFHPKHNVYIFGHSLDVTDKDILKSLILNENVHTTVFYCKKKNATGEYDNGKKDLGQKIANLVKVIGQNELLRRTGGSEKTIEFKLQMDTENKY